MGCIFDCLKPQNSGRATARTPLLSDNASNQHPSSARQYRPPAAEVEKEFMTSVDYLSEAHMKSIEVPSLNKTFKDQGKIYDELLETFKTLKDEINEFKSYFTTDTAGIPVLSQCIPILVDRCGGAEIKLERKKTHMVITYKPTEISKKCICNPEQILPALELFNKINKSVQKITERAPQIEKSLQILIQDEHEMQKDVSKADFNGEDGPKAMRACVDNISRLKKVSNDVKTIEKHTKLIYQELLDASKGFFIS